MNELIEKQLDNWRYIQQMGLDVLKTLSDDDLRFVVGKNMGTLGQQFCHMARVRMQYAEAIESKKLGKLREKIDFNAISSQEALIAIWKRSNAKLEQALKDSKTLESTSIDWSYWGDDQVDIHDHLNYLMDHETLHNGEIIVYLRTMGHPFPKSWAAWGL